MSRIALLIQKFESYQTAKDFSYERETAHIISQLAPIFKYLERSDQQSVIEFVGRFSDPGYQVKILSNLCAADAPIPLGGVDDFLRN